jgi:hypothetical protein
MRDGEERDASLALRCGRGNRVRKAVGWYRNHDRLHTGDPIAMAADATTAYITARAEGKDVARSYAVRGKSPTPSISASTTGSPTPMLQVWRWPVIRRPRGDLILSLEQMAVEVVHGVVVMAQLGCLAWTCQPYGGCSYAARASTTLRGEAVCTTRVI